MLVVDRYYFRQSGNLPSQGSMDWVGYPSGLGITIIEGSGDGNGTVRKSAEGSR
jgi:hypothetical protein